MSFIFNFGGNILIVCIICFTLYLIFCEFKNKSLKHRIFLLLSVIILFITHTFFIMGEMAANAAISSSFDQMKIIVEISKSDEHLLRGINNYLSTCNDTEVLSEKISELLIKSSRFYKSTILYQNYDYQQHIMEFQKIGNELFNLAKKIEMSM